MKNAWLIFLVSIFLGASSLTNAQSVSKCFRADWLQGERVIKMTINGSELTGTFSVGSGGGALPDATYKFRGKLAGNALRVAFAGGKAPDVSPSEMRSLTWILSKSAGKETLRIQFSGKNYETDKYEVRFVDFESCGDAGYAALADSARRVEFVKGAKSVGFPVAFKMQHERKSFLLNIKAGQRIAIEAPGCGISFYYPDKREGEEAAIDTWTSDALTQSGDYLFVIRPAGAPGKCAVNFRVTN